MRAGRLRERVTVQKRAAGAGAYRKDAPDWEDVVAARPARIAPIMAGAVAGENEIAQRLAGVSAYRITMRDESALKPIDTGWRLLRLDDDSPSAAAEIFDIRHVARPPDARGSVVITAVSMRSTAAIAATEGD